MCWTFYRDISRRCCSQTAVNGTSDFFSAAANTKASQAVLPSQTSHSQSLSGTADCGGSALWTSAAGLEEKEKRFSDCHRSSASQLSNSCPTAVPNLQAPDQLNDCDKPVSPSTAGLQKLLITPLNTSTLKHFKHPQCHLEQFMTTVLSFSSIMKKKILKG